MTRLWRISSRPGLRGEGGLYVDGRWHTVGRRVVYASEHPALAMVEVLAHMRIAPSNLPTTLKLIAIDVADGAIRAATPSLPSGWQANEPTSQTVGNRWLDDAKALLMPVPSAILAHATNFLLNPEHADADAHLVESSIEPFWFDRRLIR